MSAMTSVSDWLAATMVSKQIADRLWIIPLVQSIHIVAISIVMASNALLDLRLAGFLGSEQSLRLLAVRFFPWIWGALVVLLCTGLVMIMGEPARELLNWIFWTKMGLILAAVLLTLPMRTMLEDCSYRDLPRSKRQLLRLLAIASLLCWVIVLTCGRWIAYAGASEA